MTKKYVLLRQLWMGNNSNKCLHTSEQILYTEIIENILKYVCPNWVTVHNEIHRCVIYFPTALPFLSVSHTCRGPAKNPSIHSCIGLYTRNDSRINRPIWIKVDVRQPCAELRRKLSIHLGLTVFVVYKYTMMCQSNTTKLYYVY
jgi:hypothetical protein